MSSSRAHPRSVAAKQATTAIPPRDPHPVGLALLATLARPCATVAGLATLSEDWLQLIGEPLPGSWACAFRG